MLYLPPFVAFVAPLWPIKSSVTYVRGIKKMIVKITTLKPTLGFMKLGPFFMAITPEISQ